jgi:acyl-CoA-binding protein
MESVTKTELSINYTSNDSLKYLGFEYDGNNILLKPSSLSKFYREMKMSIRRKANRVNSAKRYNEKYPKRKKKDIKLHLTKLYKRFTHLGKNKSKSNYLTYVDRASSEIYPNLKGKNNPIKRQVSRSWNIFQKSINKYENIKKK